MTSGITPPSPRLRVAVVGSGLAGLTTAYLLRQRGVTVYLIEKSDKLGFHSSSIDIPDDDTHALDPGTSKEKRQEGWTVDVPMRSFQGGYYPNLIALYRHLGLPLRAQHFTFSFSDHPPSSSFSSSSSSSALPSSPSTSGRASGAYFIHSGASGFSLPSLPSIAHRNPLAFLLGVGTWLAYAGCYLLLLALAFLSYHSLLPCLFSSTLGDTVDQIAVFLYQPIPYLPFYTPLGRVWRSFIARIVVPLFSSVGTMPTSEVYATPARCILDYIHKTVGTDHYALARGCSARTVADRLAEPVGAQGEGHLRLGATITALRKHGNAIRIVIQGDAEELQVDKVVLATPASVARAFLGMLQPSLDEEEAERVRRMKKALAAVRYKETIVVTHRDASILPSKRGDIREINLVHPLPSSASGPGASLERKDGVTPHFAPSDGYTQATHVILPPASPRVGGTRAPVYQTTNPMVPVAEGSVLGIAQLERALPLRTPSKTIAGLHPSSPGSIYLAGAYAWAGIPLLEGCVGSARRVVDSIAPFPLPLASVARPEQVQVTRAGELGAIGFRGEEVDWTQGQGSIWGRAWRWRRSSDDDRTPLVR